MPLSDPKRRKRATKTKCSVQSAVSPTAFALTREAKASFLLPAPSLTRRSAISRAPEGSNYHVTKFTVVEGRGGTREADSYVALFKCRNIYYVPKAPDSLALPCFHLSPTRQQHDFSFSTSRLAGRRYQIPNGKPSPQHPIPSPPPPSIPSTLQPGPDESRGVSRWRLSTRAIRIRTIREKHVRFIRSKKVSSSPASPCRTWIALAVLTREPRPDAPQPLFGNISFYHFNMILSGAAAAFVFCTMIFFLFMHATHLRKPNEQVKYVPPRWTTVDES